MSVRAEPFFLSSYFYPSVPLVSAVVFWTWCHQTCVILFWISHHSFVNVAFSFQAEFSELNLVATSVGTYNVTVDAIRNGHKVNK